MKTALITGATEGIGYELVQIFASNHFHLILIARSEEKLKNMTLELKSKYGIDVQYFAKDLSILANAEQIYHTLQSSGITVSYLVNNAGFGINGPLVHTDWAYELQMYQLNMITLSYFTKKFSKEMVKQKFGRILNIGSTGSFQAGPYMAGYCATKAFVLSFSNAVHEELKPFNVSVSTLCPGVTDSKFHIAAKTEKTGMSKYLPHATSKSVAAYGYQLMMKKKRLGVYGLFNKLMIFSNRFIPRWLSTYISGILLKPSKTAY